MSESLNKLVEIPSFSSQQKNLDTIRDGLAQYDEQFSQLFDSKNSIAFLENNRSIKDLGNITKQARQFDDLLSYIALSTNAIVGFSEELKVTRNDNLAFARIMSRFIVICGGGILFVFLTILGFIVIRSIATTLNELASVAVRLARENNLDGFSARYSSDSAGEIAKALSCWEEALSDLFNVRQELIEAQKIIGKSSDRSEVVSMTATSLDREVFLSEKKGNLVPGNLSAVSNKSEFSENESLSSASRQLANFSEYVNAAANDVERTGSLIKGIDDSTQKMEKMNALVISVRDQINLLAFCSDQQISNPEKREKTVGGQDFVDRDMDFYVDTIRDATEQAIKIAMSVRQEMAEVTRMAREIAITSSEQAIEATTKLLYQSEHLQNMLGAVISKVEEHRVAGSETEKKNVEKAESPKPK